MLRISCYLLDCMRTTGLLGGSLASCHHTEMAPQRLYWLYIGLYNKCLLISCIFLRGEWYYWQRLDFESWCPNFITWSHFVAWPFSRTLWTCLVCQQHEGPTTNPLDIAGTYERIRGQYPWYTYKIRDVQYIIYPRQLLQNYQQ